MRAQKFPCVLCPYHEGHTVIACVLAPKDRQCAQGAVDLNSWPLQDPYRTAVQCTLCNRRKSGLRNKFHNTGKCLWFALTWGERGYLQNREYHMKTIMQKIMYISVEKNLEGFSPKCKHWGNPRGRKHTMLSLCTAHGHPGGRGRGGRHFGTGCLPEVSLFFFFSFSIYEMALYRLATAQ